MAFKLGFLLALASSVVLCQRASEPITNVTVMQMVSAGAPQDAIIQTILHAPSVNFVFFPGTLAAMSNAGVSDDIVKAMAARSKSQGAVTPMEPSTDRGVPAIQAPPKKGTQEVTIIDRKFHDIGYNYTVPGSYNATSSTNVDCYGTRTVSCTATTRTTGSNSPARQVSFEVRGATLTLLLTDGRIAVVNCDSKFDWRSTRGVRSCRTPMADELVTEFDGDNAKLQWPVSIDGKKMQSETYKILGIFEQR